MKKILLILSVAILWGCSDYAGQWEDSYGATYAQSTDPGTVLVCLEGSTTQLNDGICWTDFLCENNAWVPQNYVCNGKKQRVMCEDNETTTVVDGACTSYFVCYDDLWVVVGSPVCVQSSSSVSNSSPIVVKSSSSSRVVVRSSSSVKRSSSSRVVRSSSSRPRSSSSAKKSTSSFQTWIGWDGGSQIITGLDKGNEDSGYWFDYNDDADGGMSWVKWPVPPGNDYSSDAKDNIIDYCGGLCGTAVLEKGTIPYSPFVGVAFNVASQKGDPADASAWGGICITYTSEISASLQLGLTNAVEQGIGYANPAANLPKSTAGTMKNLRWSDFAQPTWYKGGDKLSGAEAAEQLVSVKFLMQGPQGDYQFNVCAIGPYNGGCPSTCK